MRSAATDALPSSQAPVAALRMLVSAPPNLHIFNATQIK